MFEFSFCGRLTALQAVVVADVRIPISKAKRYPTEINLSQRRKDVASKISFTLLLDGVNVGNHVAICK
jgi:hypothetical protein